MTADPPQATHRAHLSLVPPPPRPERGGRGHGLPAPVRVVAVVPDPLQTHGGGHRLKPWPVPAGPASGAEAEADAGFETEPHAGTETEPHVVPEPEEASSDDAGAPSAVPLPEEAATLDEPEDDRAPEA